MELTIKKDMNVKSVVLRHKIALETITLLDGRENILYTEKELYTMVSLVDNFIEENLIDAINLEKEDFPVIVEKYIEPKFEEIITMYNVQDVYDELVEYVDEYLTNLEYKENTFFGILNTLIDIVNEMNWEDLKFFFNKVSTEAKNALASTVEQEEKPIKKVTQEEYEGASAKMAALIDKFQKEKEEIVKERKENNE